MLNMILMIMIMKRMIAIEISSGYYPHSTKQQKMLTLVHKMKMMMMMMRIAMMMMKKSLGATGVCHVSPNLQ